MAWNVSYFSDLAMTRPTRDADQLTDRAFELYPAPTGREVAVAISCHDPCDVIYGYRGDWHSSEPPEAIARREIEDAQDRERQRQSEYASRPHVVWVRARNGRINPYDASAILVAVPGHRRPKTISLGELKAAARQDDPVGRAVHGALLQEVEEFLDRMAD